MSLQHKAPAISLYIHIPWCVRKCPYCDFNSHGINTSPLQEDTYVAKLLEEFTQRQGELEQRPLRSIFIGGGTPSLFSADSIAGLLDAINQLSPFSNNLEITMEANPGTIEQDRFTQFRRAGVNRLSIGIQSFNDKHLKALGRIHSRDEAFNVANSVREAGFDNFNLDLMYGLPEQSTSEAISDLETACSIEPTHLSWYQLTIEPNTAFYKTQPTLPNGDKLYELEQQGYDLLKHHQYTRYEVSAYCKDGHQCQHNLNYWQYGDYLGIGAGAHSKITDIATGKIQRSQNVKLPQHYLDPTKSTIAKQEMIDKSNLPFEFMLNALRLHRPIPFSLFETHTGLSANVLEPYLKLGHERGLLTYDKQKFELSELGKRFINDAITLFLP